MPSHKMTPPARVKGYHSSRLRSTRNRTTPFNLKAGGRGAHLPLKALSSLLAPRWLGPTLTLGVGRPQLQYSEYIFNA